MQIIGSVHKLSRILYLDPVHDRSATNSSLAVYIYYTAAINKHKSVHLVKAEIASTTTVSCAQTRPSHKKRKQKIDAQIDTS